VTEPVWDGRGADPWLPSRLNARLEIAAIERRIRAGVWAALSDWLVRTGRRMLRSGSPPDLDAIWARTPAWADAVEYLVRGQIFEALGAAYARILGRDFPWDQRVFVTRYLTEVRNRLTRIPAEVHDLISGQLAAGINLGEGAAQLAARVEDILFGTGSARWQNRAIVIARTEAIGAMNAGRLDAFRAVAEQERQLMEKVWLATEDDRTRPTHAEADQQRVPLAAPFEVGGFALQFPGDPSGPPQEIIQCRCTLILVEPGESVDLSSRQFRER
jgi:hypothetical protein